MRHSVKRIARALARAMGRRAVVVGALLGALCAGCGGGGPDGSAGLPWDTSARIPPAPVDMNDSVIAARADLGRLLFYDTMLSVDGETACATCHSEFWGMGDGLPLAIGHGAGLLAGPGRKGPNVLTRNAPSLWNAAYRKDLFWDGRAHSLEEQAMQPLDATNELDLNPGALVAKIRMVPGYVERFGEAFPDDAAPVSEDNVAKAIAIFERTIVSRRAPYDAFFSGDPLAMTESQQAGMQVFADAGCADCHTPPLFESDRYFDRGIGDGSDPGRYDVTRDEADRGAFRVRTLRNLFDTRPYFHDGSVRTPEAAIQHELDRSGFDYTPEQLDELVDFIIKGLYDPLAEPVRPDTLPSGFPTPFDGLHIVRPTGAFD
ncbi:MAG: hypothetical protein KC543_08725 [Myxococcales bacterium]|nr:hypothetical protein [Myxococcales bacterium]